ncbi:MAG TPA: DUF29 family protein, partial [Deltaproteobacteria bacterium]|nr:DUF29 family protein [Deltaproteobacteria bacterium]
MPETETAGYDQDYHLWFLSQARLARSRQAEASDLEHLAEELEDMG